jgi:hypothetical protein
MCVHIYILNCLFSKFQSATTSEAPNSAVSREASTQSSSATTSQGYVLPEGKIMPNTVFVGGIDVRVLYSYFIQTLNEILKPQFHVGVGVGRGGRSA